MTAKEEFLNLVRREGKEKIQGWLAEIGITSEVYDCQVCNYCDGNYPDKIHENLRYHEDCLREMLEESEFCFQNRLY